MQHFETGWAGELPIVYWVAHADGGDVQLDFSEFLILR
jgi:hypothetical protein